MIALEQARHYMETLGLTQAAAVLDSRLDAATQKQLSYPEVLADLLGIEAAARRERYLTTRTRLAHLPFHRTLEQFDPSAALRAGFRLPALRRQAPG
jgi:DNA replication protein DnaC